MTQELISEGIKLVCELALIIVAVELFYILTTGKKK